VTRLFTVEVTHYTVPNPVHYMRPQHVYECWFAEIHFSREHEVNLKHWVRVAARNVYGKDTQVIFVHEEGQ
jgi:hypothetical protein